MLRPEGIPIRGDFDKENNQWLTHALVRSYFLYIVRASPKERTVNDARERPLHPVNVDLPHDEAVLGVVARTGLKGDGVEDGPLQFREGGQTLGEVIFGERHEGTIPLVWRPVQH